MSRRQVGLLALWIAEAAGLLWYFTVPLPNAGNLGGDLRRWVLVAQTAPGVIPGVSWAKSQLGQAVDQLSHVGNLPQRGPLVLAAGLIAGAAIVLGQAGLRALRLHAGLAWFERLPLTFALGVNLLGTLALAAGRLGLLTPWSARIGLGILLGVGGVWSALGAWRRGAEAARAPCRTRVFGRFGLVSLLVVTGPFVILTALAAMQPTIEFDALEYHLQGPKEFFLAGRVMFLPHNVYTSMPFSVEMLHLLAMEVLGDWYRGALAGQLLIMLHGPATALLVALTARRLASPRAAWVAAIAYLTTPWTYHLGAIPFVEGPLCLYHAALAWAIVRFWSPPQCSMVGERAPDISASMPESEAGTVTAPHDRSSVISHSESALPRVLGLIGLLAGGAMACKYPALISAVIPAGLLMLASAARARSSRVVLAFVVGWGIAVGPWLVRNVADTGNPVYPLAYNIFGGTSWSTAQDQKWRNVHGPRAFSFTALGTGLLDIAGRSDWQSPLFLALVPLALLHPGARRWAWALFGYAAYLFATWFLLTHRLERFLIPVLPVMAVLAGLGADWTRGRSWTLLLVIVLSLSLIASFAMILTPLPASNEWTGDLDALRVTVPEQLNPQLARVDAELPPAAKVLLVGQAAVFHLRHQIVYNTVFNDEILETITRDRPPAQILTELRRCGITHVFVDWHEIARHRKPGGYGFTDFVTPELFTRLIEDGVLEPARAFDPEHELYRVR